MPKPPFPAAGGAMPALGPTPRRSLLAGLAASPIALPVVAEAAIIPDLTGPHPDQALIGSSVEYAAIELAIGNLLKEDEDHLDLDQVGERRGDRVFDLALGDAPRPRGQRRRDACYGCLLRCCDGIQRVACGGARILRRDQGCKPPAAIRLPDGPPSLPVAYLAR